MVCKLGSSPMDCKSVKDVLTGLVNSCDHSGQGNGTLASLCILGFVWWIWHKRNERLFNGKIRSWNLLLRSILTQVRTNAMFLSLQLSPDVDAAWNITPHRHSPASSKPRVNASTKVLRAFGFL